MTTQPYPAETMFMPTEIGYWLSVRDGDPRAFAIFSRHYSYHAYADGRRRPGYRNRFLIMGPGEKLVLLGADERALFGWRRGSDASQGYCVSCTVFRNESNQRSSDLIREAAALAWERWPGERLVTYVAPTKIKSSNPGYCFLMAGWRKCGETKCNKLVILECLP